MRPWIGIVLVILQAGCTLQRREDVSGLLQAPHPSLQAPLLPGSEATCDMGLPPCTDHRSPSLCVASTYEDKTLPPLMSVHGWGDNECEARNRLVEEVCKLGWIPSKVGRVYCLPDPADGECLASGRIEYAACYENHEVKGAHICIAHGYQSQKLSAHQAPRGYGTSLCSAKKDLIDRSCMLQLRPSLLEDIRCKPDALAGACSAPFKPCSKGYQPHECSVDIGADSEQTFGSSKCEALNEMRYTLCQMDLDPSAASAAKCRRVSFQ